MIVWTLTLGAVTKTLAEWGISEPSLSRANLTADRLSFSAPRVRFDEDDLCEQGAAAVLTRTDGSAPGVVWFRGTRQPMAYDCQPQSETQTYLFEGPWRFLAENVYQQPWGGIYTSHIIVNGSVGQNIKAVLDYAIARGALLTYVLADLTALAAYPPANEITGQLCSSVILASLQFAPDVVSWCDYSTNPPTLRFVPRASLAAVSVRLADYDDDSMPAVNVLAVRPREDLQVPSVKINYETIVTIDGVQSLVPGVEIAPGGATGLEDGAFTDTVIRQGLTQNNLFASLECVTVESSSLEWWKKHVAKFREERVTVTGPISLGYRDSAGGLLEASAVHLDEDGVFLPLVYPRELPRGGGQIAPWMNGDDGEPLLWQTEFIKAAFTIVETDAAGVKIKEETRFYTVEIVTTTAPAGVSDYSAVESQDFGDPPITGLAAYLYAALSPLQYEGAVHLEEQECSGALNLGYALNLYGSRAAFQTMGAVIQQVTFDIDSGRTAVTFGPPRHLTIGDLLALMERFRISRRYTNPATQETGEIGGGDSGELELGQATGSTNTSSGSAVPEYSVVQRGSTRLTLDAQTSRVTLTDGVRTILLDIAAGRVQITSTLTGAGSIDLALGDTGGKDIKLRVVPVCENGVNKSIIVAASPIF